jgi:hypothetical protein
LLKYFSADRARSLNFTTNRVIPTEASRFFLRLHSVKLLARVVYLPWQAEEPFFQPPRKPLTSVAWEHREFIREAIISFFAAAVAESTCDSTSGAELRMPSP